MSIRVRPPLTVSLQPVVEEMFQPDRICSLGFAPNVYYTNSMKLEVGVEVPEVIRMIEQLLNRERRVICYNDGYAMWCESMGQLIGQHVNQAHLGHGSEIWTRFEGDAIWCQSVIWQNVDLGRATLQSLAAEGALVERSHTALRTGVVTPRFYVVQEGLDAWTAARLLQLEEPCS